MPDSVDKKQKGHDTGKKPGLRDKDYVNKGEKYETDYEPKRKTPAKQFGKN